MSDSASKNSRPDARFLIILTVVVVAVLILSSSLLLFSFMAFDAGETPSAWAAFIAIWMTPVVMILGLLIAWIGYAARSRLVTRIGIGICSFR